jgi:hypothetical protein
MSLKSGIVLALPVSAFALCFGMAAQAADVLNLPVDHPVQISGVETACTGIGNREEHEARWSDYSVKLETVGGYGQWLGNENVTLRAPGGAQVLRVHCSAPWVMMELKPGRYDATVRIPNAPPHETSFTVPASGQRDVIVRFTGRMAGRETTPPATSG